MVPGGTIYYNVDMHNIITVCIMFIIINCYIFPGERIN